MELVKGQKYYHYNDAGGCELIYEAETETEFVFKAPEEMYSFRILKNERNARFEVHNTFDLAKIAFLKIEIKEINENIIHHQKYVNKYVHKLKSLQERTQELKEDYPEEFI